ncbi:unnamed protein product [Discula destructiva]
MFHAGSESMPQIENGSDWGSAVGDNSNSHHHHHHQQDASDNIDAFGSIETPDASYLITTRTVLICRDLAAFKRYKAMHLYEQRAAENKQKGLDPPTPPKKLRVNAKGKPVHPSPSSQGGILHEEGLPEEDIQDPLQNRKHSASGNVLGQYETLPDDPGRHMEQFAQPGDHTADSVPVDISKLLPDENAVARLYIHGQGPDFYLTTKGISREHLKIQYNANKRVWEAHGLGRNGFFCEDVLVKEGASVTLTSGAQLQIQNIPIIFHLKNVPRGKDGSEVAYSEDGKKKMSLEFVGSHHGQAESSDEDMEDDRESFPLTLSSDKNAKGGKAPSKSTIRNGDRLAQTPDGGRYDYDSDSDENEYGEDDYAVGDDVEDIRETVEKQEQSPSDADHLSHLSIAQRKRGPGRPPKNGIMSKREEKLLKKQLQEEAKRNLPPLEPGEQPQKRKVGRPRKHPLPEGAEGSAEKRPYKSRKIKGEDGTEDAEGDKPAKEKSQKHKTPPLELKREDFTEEQLQKPTKNYQLLIDEIMSSAPPKGYSLKQIYKRIQEKWPHFYFRVDTKGWESSVRHNLLGSDCFTKIDGNWHRVAGVPLDAGKKRKPSDSAADSRPAMYNGYGQPPYQHHQAGQPGQAGHPHGHQLIPHPTGLGQPNLPPRYPPNGQAYQIHQGPHANINQPGGPPQPQGPPRPAFSQHQAPAAGPANAYAPVGQLTRPQHSGPQPPAHQPAFGNRPQPPHPVAPGPGSAAGLNAQQRPPMARPGSGPAPHPTMPVTHTNLAPNMRTAAPPGPQQAQPPPPTPLEPLIEPELRNYIRDFRVNLIKTLVRKDGKRAEAITMSVINRGLRLADRSLAPEAQDVENQLLTIFHKHMSLYPKHRGARAAGKPVPSARSRTPHVKDQGNKAAVLNGPVTSTGAQALSPARALATAGTTKTNPDATSRTSTAGPTQSAPVPAASNSTTPAPTAPDNTARLSTGPISTQPRSVDSVAPAPSSAVGEAAPSGPSNASATAPKPSPTVSPQTASAPSGSMPSKPDAADPAGPSSNSTAPSTAVVKTPTTPAASTAAAAPSDVAGSVSTSCATDAAPNASESASAAPAPGSSATTTTTTTTTATAAPQAVNAGPAPSAPPAVAAVNAVGGPRLPSSTPIPAAGNGTAPNASRATSTAPGTPATPSGDEAVQLLDPKLVQVVMKFKKSILPTLAVKLNANLAECLILSAVNRKFGLTDNTFVQAKTDQQRKNYEEAERALMQHLETRFNQYRNDRANER